MKWWSCLAVLLVVVASEFEVEGKRVTYDGRALIIDGQRKLLFSGEIHYPRSTPEMWPSLIANAKKGGIDVIQTYVFWNQHEPQRGQYNFEGRNDLVRFMREIQAQGLYATLRIGPFIEAEWNYGGLPFWLHDIPGIVYRSDNEPFKHYMQAFTTKIVNLMKSERLYASQGGPIILSQIENEYQNIEAAFHEKGPPYVRWAAQMAVDQRTGVPWVMCKQDDAPDPVINACNGLNCGETFVGPNSPNKPALWTENWTFRYRVFGQEQSQRSIEDIAYAVVLFIAKKQGSYVNYYMYHGGTNFGRTGSSYVLTKYYEEAPLDEYGLINEPKWGHLKELHAAVKLVSETLLHGVLTNVTLGEQQEAYVYTRNSGDCVAFLVNSNTRHDTAVKFRHRTYQLPHASISILLNCKDVIFNTKKVNAKVSTRSFRKSETFDAAERWQTYKEITPNYADTRLKANKLLEHTVTTKDTSDYLWYTLSLNYRPKHAQQVLELLTFGHVVHTFVNNRYVGNAHGFFGEKNFTLRQPISLNNGENNISLLSVMYGLQDSGAYLERRIAGLQSVKIAERGEKTLNFGRYSWGYQVGLLGEKLKIYTNEGIKRVRWSSIGRSSPLSWYKATFDAPRGDAPVVLNLGSMGKGEAWVNGQSIGRYWSSFLTQKGNPSQTLYHVPRSFLKPSNNLLVLLEELGGNPLRITLDTMSNTKLCGYVSDSHLPPVDSSEAIKINDGRENNHQDRKPRIQLECPPGMSISKIIFASFGNPSGNCSSYGVGSCHSPHSRGTVEKACLGKNYCSVAHSSGNFGGDPCPSVSKSLLIDVQCGRTIDYSLQFPHMK